MRLLALLAALPTLCAACRTTATQVPVNMESAVVLRATAVSAWRVEDEGALAGYVVRFDAPEREDRSYFSVRNEHRQEIGLVDRDGRAWRYRAFVRDAEWVGTGTVRSGVRTILGTSERTRLVSIPVEQLGTVQPSVLAAPDPQTSAPAPR